VLAAPLCRHVAAQHCKVIPPPVSNASRHLFLAKPASQRGRKSQFLKSPIQGRNKYFVHLMHTEPELSFRLLQVLSAEVQFARETFSP